MAYRTPAEDREAKLDAEEMAAFVAMLRGAARRARIRVALVIVGGIAVMAAALWFVARRPQACPPRRGGCHTTYVVSGEPEHATSVTVCSPERASEE